MIDLNSGSQLSDRINNYIDRAMIRQNQKEPNRDYLGGSRLGAECERALQYEFFNAPKDEDKNFKGQTLRIFKRGFWVEDAMANWIENAGFDLKIENKKGQQFGFSAFEGKLKGHCDGVFIGGHSVIKYPALWENKGINQAGWKKLSKNGLIKAYPEYYAQIQIYQKYFGLTENPAIFTAVNMNTMEIYWEKIKHNQEYSDLLVEKAQRIFEACKAQELLPKQFHSAAYYKCKWCSWQKRCWDL